MSLYDEEGERLETIYVAAAPEAGKATLHERLDRELERVRKHYPEATVVGIADGAEDNWTYLDGKTDIQTLDFYHASEYLSEAAKAAIPNDKTRAEWMEINCHRLKHNKTGPKAVIAALEALSDKKLSGPKLETVETSITYFKNQKHRMGYAHNVKHNLVIGSGVIEAACKVIVKQRLCQSGMRWKRKGIGTILSLRTLTHTTGRWDQMWRRWDSHGYPFAQAA